MAGLVFLAGAAQAQDPPRISITVYNSNLALVEEARTLDVPAGRSRLEFKDVSASIRPETVALSADGVSIVEQNFDFDLLSPAKMMEKAVGRQVQIVRINPGNGQEVRETATVLAVNDGVVLRIGDRVEILRDDGVPTRVIFDKVPENLRPNPTLSVTLDARRAGPRPATLSYLTTGLSWKADYVALFDEKIGKLDLQGWITLTNTSGTSFADADTRLVAGDINIVRSEEEYWRREQASQRPASTRVAGYDGQASPGADYYLYPLEQRTTIAQNQTKQVGFIDVVGVTGTKAYQYTAHGFQSDERFDSATVILRFSNSAGSGLGAPLPSGIVRAYIRDALGDPKFVGEDLIEHAPQGSALEVRIGEAFDVTVQPTLIANERVNDRRSRFSMSYVLRNARPEPVTVELVQPGLWRDGRVLRESLGSRRVNASTLAWNVPVPANGEATLTFIVETGW